MIAKADRLLPGLAAELNAAALAVTMEVLLIPRVTDPAGLADHVAGLAEAAQDAEAKARYRAVERALRAEARTRAAAEARNRWPALPCSVCAGERTYCEHCNGRGTEPCTGCDGSAVAEYEGLPLCRPCGQRSLDPGHVALLALTHLIGPNGLDQGAGRFRGLQLGRRALKLAGKAVR